jgi:hypothetical protein
VIIVAAVFFEYEPHMFSDNYNNLNKQASLLIAIVFIIKIGVRIANMKKSTANPSHIKTSIQKELQKPYRPIANVFGAVQEQQEKRNANSIKKILKELTDLKK